MKPCVVEIHENVVKSLHIFDASADAEKCFFRLWSENDPDGFHNIPQEERDIAIEDGYVEIGDWSICLSWGKYSPKA